jgi:hypothetical protein
MGESTSTARLLVRAGIGCQAVTGTENGCYQ